jgi:flagellar hook-associated protein FlgK
MKIYFSSAMSNVTNDVRDSQDLIVSVLKELGHVVVVEHRIGKIGENLTEQSEDEALAAQRKMSKWKKQVDLMVVETSVPSFGVGQEISEALADNKQVVALYLKGSKPHLLQSGGKDQLYLAEYDVDNLKKVLGEYIEYARTRVDTRFNFFISPAIGSYLDWIAKNRRVPRAVYLRRLIEKDMKENKEYNEE